MPVPAGWALVHSKRDAHIFKHPNVSRFERLLFGIKNSFRFARKIKLINLPLGHLFISF